MNFDSGTDDVRCHRILLHVLHNAVTCNPENERRRHENRPLKSSFNAVVRSWLLCDCPAAKGGAQLRAFMPFMVKNLATTGEPRTREFEVAQRSLVAGFEPQGFAELGNGFLQSSLAAQCAAEVRMDAGIVGIQPQ